jgi:hypothetical protein
VTTTRTLRDRLTAGFVAGLVGGVLIEAFLHAADWALRIHADQLPLVAGYIGSFLPGAGPVLVHYVAHALLLAVAVGWGIGYVWSSRTSPQLLARPWLSGAAFGFIVYIVMQVMLLTAGLYHRPDFDVLLVQLAAYALAFGIPVGVVASRMLRTP